MLAIGEVVVTERLLRVALRVVSRRSLIVVRLIGVLSTLLGVLILAETDGALVGMFLVTVGPIYVIVVPSWQVARAARKCRPALATPWRYEVSERGLRITTSLAMSEVEWPTMVRAAEHDEFWLLEQKIKNHHLILFKGAFSADDQRLLTERLSRLVGLHSSARTEA